MLPLAVIGRVEWLLILGVLAMFFGGPLLISGVVFGSWLRRTGRGSAFKTYMGAAICGAIAFVTLLGAIGVLASGSVHDRYASIHPVWPLLMIAFGALTLAAIFATVFFGLWTIWRLIEAPPSAPAAQQR